jgi:hypothetical protein
MKSGQVQGRLCWAQPEAELLPPGIGRMADLLTMYQTSIAAQPENFDPDSHVLQSSEE